MNYPLLTTQEAAAYIGLSPLTLKKWRRLNIGPEYHRIGHKCVRYAKHIIDAWLDARRNTAQAATGAV